MLSRKIVILLVLALFSLLCGCDGGASYDTPGNPRPVPTATERIAGTWRVRSYASPSGGLQQCPSTTVAFSCADNTRWVFRKDGSLTDANGVVRTFTFDGTNLEYFGKPANFTVTVTQLTDTLMAWNMTGVPGVAEPVSLLLERAP